MVNEALLSNKIGIIDFGNPINAGILKDKSVLITGGASGLGALISTAFSRNGTQVAIAGLDVSLGKELAATNKKSIFIRSNVTDWSSQVQSFKAAIAIS